MLPSLRLCESLCTALKGFRGRVQYAHHVCEESLFKCRQAETLLEKELAPGALRPLRWTDAALPPRLSVRIQDAGWLWSGGFALDAPGDIFVNIRHR